MKRCPACKRVENDDTLVYCRADGTPLVSDSGSVSAGAGTVRFEELSVRSYVPPYNIATVDAALGDKDEAFAWLDRAYADRSFYLTWIKVDPQMDSLRLDPRFADLMRRVGLPQ